MDRRRKHEVITLHDFSHFLHKIRKRDHTCAVHGLIIGRHIEGIVRFHHRLIGKGRIHIRQDIEERTEGTPGQHVGCRIFVKLFLCDAVGLHDGVGDQKGHFSAPVRRIHHHTIDDGHVLHPFVRHIGKPLLISFYGYNLHDQVVLQLAIIVEIIQRDLRHIPEDRFRLIQNVADDLLIRLERPHVFKMRLEVQNGRCHSVLTVDPYTEIGIALDLVDLLDDDLYPRKKHSEVILQLLADGVGKIIHSYRFISHR